MGGLFDNKKKETDKNIASKEGSYIEIMERCRPYLRELFPKTSADWLKVLDKSLGKETINRQIAKDSYGQIIDQVSGQGNLRGEYERRLSKVMGMVIQNESEVNTFLTGLASDHWMYGATEADIVKTYRKYPVLVSFRLYEILVNG
jgi:hypothetical protein